MVFFLYPVWNLNILSKFMYTTPSKNYKISTLRCLSWVFIDSFYLAVNKQITDNTQNIFISFHLRIFLCIARGKYTIDSNNLI